MDPTIIVINGSAKTGGFLPNPEEIRTKTLIVDPNLIHAVRLYQGQLARRDQWVLSDLKQIQSYKDPRVEVIPLEISKVKTPDSNIIYLVYQPEPVSSYQLMSLVGDYNIKNQYISTNRKIDLRQLLADYKNYQAYDLYSGDRLIESISKIDLEQSYRQIKSGCTIVQEYLRAGFQKRENRCIIPSWCMNPETNFIKGCINRYGLISPVPDTTPILEITTNSGYRYQLLDIMCRVIINFGFNNGLIDQTDLSKFGYQDNPELYKKISSALP